MPHSKKSQASMMPYSKKKADFSKTTFKEADFFETTFQEKTIFQGSQFQDVDFVLQQDLRYCCLKFVVPFVKLSNVYHSIIICTE
ncbi:MAG: hypothetical protein HeimC3_16990 [Candidatus Heimdallarchaeota archaeon LC_3]|nr:MAG: hypothetical protein HeimC3_16990 [Candidatus Heimdallarchaeota archaeon LC_3]